MAEELAQQTLLQVWRKAHLFNADKAAASTWIFRIARNLRLDLIRKEKHFDYDDQNLSDIEDDRETAETQMDRHQHAMMLRSALQKLPQEQIEIVQLSFYDGLSHGEIAKKLDVPLGTVKSRMRLAFKRIKDSVGEVL
jgi:RNA polymerase sigma-70 factor (ECF subfamily)